jgi:hypothetical protein
MMERCSHTTLRIARALAMSKFEWMELETLSTEITHAQSRLDAARATKNLGLVQLLEREIGETVKKRAEVIAQITKGLGRFAGPKPKLVTAPVHQPERAPVERQEPAEEAQSQTVDGGGSAQPALSPDTMKGVNGMWDKLTAADLERVKRGLAARRSEMLARHAEELKGLEADQSEIDVIENAIAAFTEKFKLTSTAEVIPLDGERVPA